LYEIGKSLKQLTEDEISSGKVLAGLSKLPFYKVKSGAFLSV